MSDMNAQNQTLAAELAATAFKAEDLPNLARNIYVRCLLKVRSAGGRSVSARTIALSITAQVLKHQVGFHFTKDDVSALLDEEDGPPEAAAAGGDKKPAIKQ
jgi:hypothetical protein